MSFIVATIILATCINNYYSDYDSYIYNPILSKERWVKYIYNNKQVLLSHIIGNEISGQNNEGIGNNSDDVNKEDS